MSSQDLNLIILKNSELKTYESFLSTLKIPVANELWYQNCLQRNVYVKPESFFLGFKSSFQNNSIQREIFKSEMRILSENKLRKCMREVDSGDNSFWFLSDCVAYFYNNEENYDKILRDIVNLGGGFYLNQFTVAVTHLITQEISEEELGKFKKFGSNFFVLHPLWLKDCFFYKRRVPEYDYYILPGVSLRTGNEENILAKTNRPLIKKASFGQEESVSFRFQPEMAASQFRASNGNIKSNRHLKKTPSKERSAFSVSPFKKDQSIQIKSFLFMQHYFFINASDFQELRSYRQKILENSGKMVDSLKNAKNHIFYVLSDGAHSISIKAQKMEGVTYVSFRWIDYCLEKKQVIKNYMELKLIQLVPLNYKMPLKCFQNSCMYVCGYLTQEKLVLRSLMKIMGIQLIYDKEKISHLICERKDNKKYKEIMEMQAKGDKAPKVVKAQWIFKCLMEGKQCDDSEFTF